MDTQGRSSSEGRSGHHKVWSSLAGPTPLMPGAHPGHDNHRRPRHCPGVPWGPVHPGESPGLEELILEQATGLCGFSSRNTHSETVERLVWGLLPSDPALVGQSVPPASPEAVQSVLRWVLATWHHAWVKVQRNSVEKGHSNVGKSG